MSEAIAKHEGNGALVPMFGREQIELIKRTVCPSDATDDELKLFMHVAQKSGLDPLQKQIHFTKRQGRMTIIAGIDGLRARATREPDFEGLLHGVVCAKDEVEFSAATGEIVKHTYNPFGERGPIIGAWATVKRKGKLPFTANVKFSEFAQMNSPTWKTMPSVMIDKVAQSTALRMAYPEQFSSIYEQAEMDQAEPPKTVPGAATAALKEKLLAAVPTPERKMVIQDVEREDPPPPGDEAAPHDEETGEVIDAVPAQEEPAVMMPFGGPRTKGKLVTELSKSDLNWYAKVLAENVADAAKARFKADNERLLAAVKREQARR